MPVNPFVFGKVVQGKDFCNRTAEMNKIKQAARTSSSLIIASPRRYGKTSLVINALEKYQIPFLFIDCFEIRDEKTLLEKITSGYLSSLRKGDILDKIKYLSKIMHLEYSFTIKGITVRIARYEEPALRTVLEEASRKHLVVFDEFQDIFTADHSLVKKIRAVLQFLPRCFIFLGSKKHLLLYLFADQRSPFYNFGSILYLDKIPQQEWHSFVTEKFRGSKLSIRDDEINFFLQAAELIPFYVQYLLFYYWQDKMDKKETAAPDFLAAVIQSNSYIYDELVQKLPLAQKKALQIIAQASGQIFSQENQAKYGFKSNQSLHKSLTALIEKGFLEKNGDYTFNDPLFKRHIQELDRP